MRPEFTFYCEIKCWQPTPQVFVPKCNVPVKNRVFVKDSLVNHTQTLKGFFTSKREVSWWYLLPCNKDGLDWKKNYIYL